MTSEQQFRQKIIDQYQKEGWAVQNTTSARAGLGFEPDLLLQRGDDHLVVEIRKEGFASTRATKLFRKRVESKDGWKFEVKFVPANLSRLADTATKKLIVSRLNVAKKLKADGFSDEAFVIAWTAIEAALRSALKIDENADALSLNTLFQKSYEEDLISEKELYQLQRGLQVRNRLVHGLTVGSSDTDASDALAIAENLVERPADKTSVS